MTTKEYFSFRGRMNRKPYWIKGLLLFLIGVAGCFIVVVTAAFLVGAFYRSEINLTVRTIFLSVLMLVAFWPLIAISAQRLHDRGKSAWWLLPFGIAPLTLQLIGDRFDGAFALLFYAPAFVLYLWGTIEVYFLRGTDGPNQYGADPLQQY